MYESIIFYVMGDKLDIYGHTYDLGTVATAVLNIPKEDFAQMMKIRKEGEPLLRQYKEEPADSLWYEINEKYSQIDEALSKYELFRIIKSEDTLFENVHRQLKAEVTNKEDKISWRSYERHIRKYDSVLNDIMWFNNTIYNFIKFFLSNVEQLTPNYMLMALSNFLFGPSADKYISNPIAGSGWFTFCEPVDIHYITKEIEPGEYRLCDYFEVSMFQSLLKTDFYKALEAGHVIRRCEYCGRFFLLKKAYHTKYCSAPSPNNPRFTCAQLGYRASGVKEAKADDPFSQALRRCIERLKKDKNRENISEADCGLLIEKAKDIYHDVVTKEHITATDFEESLQTDNLCKLCGVETKSKSKGTTEEKE